MLAIKGGIKEIFERKYLSFKKGGEKKKN